MIQTDEIAQRLLIKLDFDFAINRIVTKLKFYVKFQQDQLSNNFAYWLINYLQNNKELMFEDMISSKIMSPIDTIGLLVMFGSWISQSTKNVYLMIRFYLFSNLSNPTKKI